MVLLYDATVIHNVQWARSVPGGVEAVVVSDLPTFDDVIGRAQIVVAFIPNDWEKERILIGRLRALRVTHPLKSVIIVRTSHDAPPIPIAVDVTFCIKQAQQTLWSTIRSIEERGLSQRLADVVREAANVPPLLRLAIIHVLLRPVPLSSIKELAAEMGYDRRTIPRTWDVTFGNSAGRLMDFLDWIVLLYVTGRKSSKRSWTLVARDVGLVEDTLARSTRKLLNLTLSQLAKRGQPCIIARFKVIFEQLFGRWPEAIALDVPLQRPRRRIFVVDDHEAIVQFLDHSLRRAGFDVVTAASGIEALGHLDREQTPPALVLTDIKMAGMDGIELAKRITQQWPSVHVILMSAFVSPDFAQGGSQNEQLGRRVKFLAKPFTPGRVMALLRETCEEID